jgi:eukaryotic-like serine/threonine-protein kinase
MKPFRCPQGHQWGPTAAGPSAPGDAVCPFCGTAAVVPPDGTSPTTGPPAAAPAWPGTTETLATCAASGPAAPPPSPPENVPGYEVLRELGRGGMGVVYLARQAGLGRAVALKMLLGGHAGAAERERFQAEAEAVARLQHPNIVQVHEVGEHGGRAFFSLELCAGGSLKERLAGRPQPPHEAARLVEVLARAVHHAHERGIVHRDLKPSNVLLTADGTPKVSDFGLAKRLDADQDRTQSGAVLGTPAYMAPEQALGKGRGGPVGPAADVYSLGAVLYDLLTGRPPFQGETALDTLEQVLSQEPVAVRRLQPKVPRDLETVCLKCLQKEARKRYASAAELVDDLQRFLKGEPVRARPVGAWGRLRKWARRRPAVAALSAAVLATAALGFALVTWKWRAALHAQAEAERAQGAEHEAREREAEKGRQALAAFGEAKTNLYFHRVTLAEREWSAGRVAEAEALLDLCPPGLRRWEWSYLKRRCREAGRTLRTGDLTLGAVAFSPDGKRLAAAGGDVVRQTAPGRLKVWDAATGKVLWAAPDGAHSGLITAVAFSPDGKQFASATRSVDIVALFRDPSNPMPPYRGEVKVWDAATGRLLHTLDGFSSVSFGPDGTHLLATAGTDGTVKVWDTRTGKPAFALAGHKGRVLAAAFSPDGKRLSSSAKLTERAPAGALRMTGELKVWDVAVRKELRTVPFAGPRVPDGLAFSPDGKRLALAGLDNAAHVRDAETGAEVLALRGHTDTVVAVAFSPGGRYLVTGSMDQTVRVWGAATGEERYTLRGHDGTVYAVACAAGGEAPALASAAGDGTIKTWRPAEGACPVTLRGHEAGVARVVFSPAGDRLASCSPDDGTVRLWDVRSGKEALRLRCRASGAAFSPDGRRLATGGGDALRPHLPGELVLWGAHDGRELRRLEGHRKLVVTVAFSPDGKSLASASADPRHQQADQRVGEVKVWDGATGQELRTLPRHDAHVNGLAFSPDGRLLAVAEFDDRVYVYEAATGREAHALRGQTGGPLCVAFRPDGRRLIAAGGNGTATEWDAATGEVVRSLRLHGDSVGGLAYSPDGSRLASAGFDIKRGKGEVKLWEAETGREILTLPGQMSVAFSPDGYLLAAPAVGELQEAAGVRLWKGSAEVLNLPGGAGAGFAVAVRPDGKRLAAAFDRSTVRIWDRATGEEAGTLQGHTQAVLAVAYGRDGRRLLTASFDHTAKVWGADTFQEVATLRGHTGSVWAAAYSPDGRHVATGGDDRTVRLWEAEAGKQEHAWAAHEKRVTGLAYSPDGRLLASCSQDNTVKVWSATDGSLVRSLPAQSGLVVCVAFSPDGKRLASAGRELKVWDTETGQELMSLQAAVGGFYGVAFSPDGARLGSCGAYGEVTVWGAPSGRPLRTFRGHTDRARGVAFAPDGRHVLSVSYDGSVKVWDADGPE